MSSHVADGAGGSQRSFYKGTNPILGLHPQDPLTCQRPHRLAPSYWGLGFNTNWGSREPHWFQEMIGGGYHERCRSHKYLEHPVPGHEHLSCPSAPMVREIVLRSSSAQRESRDQRGL